MLDKVRPEMRAIIYFMVALSLIGIGLLLGQKAFALEFLAPP